MKIVLFVCLISGFLFTSIHVYGQSISVDEIHKQSVQKNLEIARKCIIKNQEDSALVFLNALLAKKYNHEEALFLRAKIHNNQNKLLEALTDYNALLALNPDNKEALYSRGILRYSLSQYALAIEDFQHAMEIPNSETQTAFFRMEEGSNRASGISTMSGMKADLWNNLGLCYLALGQFENAIQSFNAGLMEDNQHLDLYVNRALTYEKYGKLDLAINDYKYVLSEDPSHVIAAHNLMILQKAQDTDTDQLESLNEFINENPTFSHGYSSRGLFYYDQKAYALARSDFQKALEIQPENVNYIFNLALCEVKLEHFSSAETLFLDVISLDPAHSGAYFNLGNLQFRQKLYEEAISYYTIAHQLNPKNMSILYNRSLAYYESGNPEKACQDMEVVKKTDPDMAASFYAKCCTSAQ